LPQDGIGDALDQLMTAVFDLGMEMIQLIQEVLTIP
jgi:hypothetical protein